MTALALGQLLSLYTWFALTALILIVMLIARFYQQFSGINTLYRWFTLPIAFFAAAVLRYNSVDQIVGDSLGDLLAGVGGAVLIWLIVRLSRQMLHRTSGLTGRKL
ncbi:MAG: hypothetical protein CUN53_06535 [Phototrophicales bacterium]|nr:MAG: hypothetical protein CUN53_06535 [Phototrophicales bacterium]